MLRKISLFLLSLTVSLSANAYSLENNTVPTLGMTMELELVPNQPQVFINYMFWTIEATCKIISQEESTSLYVEALAKKGKINNTPLSAGQSVQITVFPNEEFKLSAESGAKVQITNLGQNTVKASCST